MSEFDASNGVLGGSAAASAPKNSALVESAIAEAAKAAASVLMLVSDIFHVAFADLDSKGKVIYDKTNAKTDAMKQLELLRNDVQSWNESVIGDELQIEKTDEILLLGTKIPESAYSRCAYKLSSDGKILYADFPPKVYEDYMADGKTPSAGELVFVEKDNTYKVYIGGATVNIDSPLKLKTVPGPDVDFSAESVGSLIFVQSSKKFYRVAADGSGVEVTGFPLQKFISTLSEKGASDLDRALENRVTAVRDLSKKDMIDIQEIISLVQVVATAMIGLLSAITSLSNNIIRNI